MVVGGGMRVLLEGSEMSRAPIESDSLVIGETSSTVIPPPPCLEGVVVLLVLAYNAGCESGVGIFVKSGDTRGLCC